MAKIFLLFFGSVVVLGVLAFAIIDFLYLDREVNPENSILSPIAKTTGKLVEKVTGHDTDLAEKDVVNILLLGIDRRSKYESAYRTDIMILVTVDKENNRVVMTSVPRDLWHSGGRLNAVYIQQGWEGLQSAFEEISGQKPDRFILTDFADFSWVVDAMGGVPVNVETAFTDHLYPYDPTNTYMTISFTAGPEKLTGARALMFARSRKGNNDNGDWGRMKRQHLVLRGMVDAITQPESFVCGFTNKTPFSQNESCAGDVNIKTIEKAFEMVTNGRMDTNTEIADLAYLWDFYKDRDKYVVESLYLDHDFLFTPPMEEYGGAWVLAPVGGSYTIFHETLENKLLGIEPLPAKIAPEDKLPTDSSPQSITVQ